MIIIHKIWNLPSHPKPGRFYTHPFAVGITQLHNIMSPTYYLPTNRYMAYLLKKQYLQCSTVYGNFLETYMFIMWCSYSTMYYHNLPHRNHLQSFVSFILVCLCVFKQTSHVTSFLPCGKKRTTKTSSKKPSHWKMSSLLKLHTFKGAARRCTSAR